MRQGQQSRRARGRNNNNNNSNNSNRKGQSPLSRSFESNGPDMKIRGTPAHIAEKYMALARDAHSSGDPVLAENYLQHAEHYNRIILAFREQQLSQGGGGDTNGLARPRHLTEGGESGDDFGDDDTTEFPELGQQPRRAEAGDQPGMQPQPRSFDAPRYEDRPQRQPQDQFPRQGRDRGDRPDRGDRSERSDRGDRPDRGERMGGYRQDGRPERGEPRPERGERQDRGERQERSSERSHQEPRPYSAERSPQPVAEGGFEPPAPQPRAEPMRRRERFPQPHEQPEFLRRSVRRPRREGGGSGEAASSEPAGAVPAPAGGDDGNHQD